MTFPLMDGTTNDPRNISQKSSLLTQIVVGGECEVRLGGSGDRGKSAPPSRDVLLVAILQQRLTHGQTIERVVQVCRKSENGIERMKEK